MIKFIGNDKCESDEIKTRLLILLKKPKRLSERKERKLYKKANKIANKYSADSGSIAIFNETISFSKKELNIIFNTFGNFSSLESLKLLLEIDSEHTINEFRKMFSGRFLKGENSKIIRKKPNINDLKSANGILKFILNKLYKGKNPRIKYICNEIDSKFSVATK